MNVRVTPREAPNRTVLYSSIRTVLFFGPYVMVLKHADGSADQLIDLRNTIDVCVDNEGAVT